MSKPQVKFSEEEWKKKLSKQEYYVLREKGTSPRYGKYENHFEKGIYKCKGCSSPLYESKTKFHSGCGWPAFYDNIKGALKQNVDKSHGMVRTEIVCATCESHLGHVFKGEGFDTPTDERHCVNSICLEFEKKN